MSGTLTKEQLLALKKEELFAKYLELGLPNDASLTKEQLADAILAKQAAAATTEPPKGGALSQTPNAQTQAPAKQAAAATTETLPEDSIHLVKEVEGVQVDELVLPIAAWNNLSASHKKEWKVKTPADIEKP